MTIQTDGWARPEERPWIRRASEWAEWVRMNHTWRCTDFLSPRELLLLESVVRNHGMVVSSFGGVSFAERKRALLMPEDWYPEDGDFQVVLLSVASTDKSELSHGGVLGSVLGTGLDRRKIGDIFSSGMEAVVAVCQDVTDYLLAEWRMVGRDNVRVEVAEAEKIAVDPPAYTAQSITVASLRLDALIAHTCQWSRTDAQSAVTGGRVTLNFVAWTRPDTIVAEGDLISVRGFGRIRVEATVGTSKRGKERVQVGVLKSNQRNQK